MFENLRKSHFQEIPLEKLGLTLKIKARPLPKADYKTTVVDDATPSTVLEAVDPSVKRKLSSRIPDLRVFPPGSEKNGVEPKSHLAFLDNKDGAICLNVINPSSSEKKIITLGDIVGKLEEGTPGLCAPQEHKSNHQVCYIILNHRNKSRIFTLILSIISNKKTLLNYSYSFIIYSVRFC